MKVDAGATEMSEPELRPMECPNCRRVFTGHGSTTIEAGVVRVVDGPAPWPGAATICAACAAVWVFREDFTLRLPTAPEWATLVAGMPGLEPFLEAIKGMGLEPGEREQ